MIADKIHYELLEQWIKILKKLLSTKYKKLEKYIFFSWWTSLMFKYDNFYRFSKNLDFIVNIAWKKFDKQFYQLFSELKKQLEIFTENNEIPVYNSFWNWREFIFQWENGIWSIKIDFMYDYPLQSEKCCEINKISDLDIFINKLQRLNKTDLQDLKFLQKVNSFDTKKIIKWIRGKSQALYWNKYYLDNKILQNISKTKWFKFLYEIENELKNI